MLAAFSVSNLNDSGTGSLRDAIAQANSAAGADTISFAANLSGGTINLTSGELVINEALTIDARPLAANITINANQLSRIINITPVNNDFVLGGLKLTGGKTTANGSAGYGAAIRSNSREDLKLFECEIVSNTVTGFNTGGGGIFSRSILTIEDSTIENNSTTGLLSVGGGIYALVGNVTIARSAIRGNSTGGNEAVGGGIWSKDSLALSDSTVSENRTTGSLAHGGGIFANSTASLTRSTVSNNTTSASNSTGGGIWSTGQVSLTQSTLSGNTTSGATAHGAGIYTNSSVALIRSTVTNNRLLVAGANGGGIYVKDTALNLALTLDHSILSANRDSSSDDNFFGDPQGSNAVNYSLIGTDVTVGTGANNIVNNNPLLAPLASNGGLTKTHALLAGSPAINAGNPGVAANPSEFDQRGTPYLRVVGGRIDIGAYESGNILAGDFDNDGDVDGRDFLRWQRGGSPAPLSSGDLSSWQGQYGTSGPSAISDPLSALTSTTESSDLLEAISLLSTSVAEATSDDETLIASEYSGEVDQAFAELGSVPRGTIRGFGEIAVRRGVPAREAMSVEFASEI